MNALCRAPNVSEGVMRDCYSHCIYNTAPVFFRVSKMVGTSAALPGKLVRLNLLTSSSYEGFNGRRFCSGV